MLGFPSHCHWPVFDWILRWLELRSIGSTKPLATELPATPHNELAPELAKSPWVEPGAPLLIATYNTQDTRLELPAETKTLPH